MTSDLIKNVPLIQLYNGYSAAGGGGGEAPTGTVMTGIKTITQTLSPVGGIATELTIAHGLTTPLLAFVVDSTGTPIGSQPQIDGSNIKITVSVEYVNAKIYIFGI